MKYTIGDIIDRLSILKLKVENKDENAQELHDQFLEEYNKSKSKELDYLMFKIYATNKKIWALESDIRKHKEKELGLEEVGRRALKIRNLNELRIEFKNQANESTNEAYIEKKI